MPPVSEQLADLGQVLAGHHGLAGHGVAQVVQPQPAELRIGADRAPAGNQTVLAAAFGVAREQERERVARAGQRGDMRPRRRAERYRARASLTVA